MARPTGFFTRNGAVLLYVPNLIGYVRVALTLYSLAVASVAPLHCIVAYVASFAMDELDGRFARMFQQTSTFGQVLDMVTDRVSTTCLLALLCFFVPQLQMAWLSLIALDLASHWLQMYASLACAGGASTHKDTASKSPMIRLYYTSRIFMGYCCISCEFLYLAIYAASQHGLAQAGVPGTGGAVHVLPARVLSMQLLSLNGLLQVSTLVALLAMPGVCVKQVVNVLQMLTSIYKLVELDQKVDKCA